jgi:hypothetical protein
MLLEDDLHKIVINPDKFDKLLTSLRAAVDSDAVLDKESTSYNDIFYAFRLELKFIILRRKWIKAEVLIDRLTDGCIDFWYISGCNLEKCI